MRFLLLLVLFFSSISFGQVKRKSLNNIDKSQNNQLQNSTNISSRNGFSTISTDLVTNFKPQITKTGDTVAPIALYLMFNEKNQTQNFDTILNISKQYKFNYLRKDTFGLLPFNNDGQTYQSLLPYSVLNNSPVNIGFNARRFSYINTNDVYYYHVPTPISELMYRSVTGKGQNLDALITINTSEQFNFFLGYRGLRSQGKYVNQLTSNGVFRIGSSYVSRNKKYTLLNHIFFQDIMNEENGGLVNTQFFETSDEPYNKRDNLTIQTEFGSSLFKGLRGYFNHSYQFNSSEKNKVLLQHKFTYEYLTNLYLQQNSNPFNVSTPYFGEAFSTTIYDKVRHTRFVNNMAIKFDSKKIGLFSAGLNSYNFYHKYNSIVFDINSNKIPNKLQDDIWSFSGTYQILSNFFDGNLLFEQAFIGSTFTKFNAEGNVKINDHYQLKLDYTFESKIPDYTFQLFQSGFKNFNWYNQFNNEKLSNLSANFNTPWVNLSGNYQIYTDKLYFSNDVVDLKDNGRVNQLIVSPKQYNKTINHFMIKAQKEFKYGQWALDNTVLFQKTIQDDAILNVPSLVTRNTLYYENYAFNKALFFQTGIVFNYFTKYYANEYHPVIGDFVVQNNVKVGNFPMFDFFLNAKIKTAQIYLNIDHFNSSITGYKYYNTPTYPYRDLTFRLGMKWNFFN